MIRKIVSVIVGYAIFVATSIALFKLSGKDPHAEATITFMLLTAIYGSAFSCIAGFAVQRIANTKDLKLNYVLALIIAGFAIFSLFKSQGDHWTQLLAIFIFAPVSILGGFFSNKQSGK